MLIFLKNITGKLSLSQTTNPNATEFDKIKQAYTMRIDIYI